MAKIVPDPLAPDVIPRIRGVMLAQPTRAGVAVRAWPRAHGPARTAKEHYLREQFRMAARMAANPEPMSLATAIAHTADSNFLPRDLLVRAAYGKAYQVLLPDGTMMTPAPHTYTETQPPADAFMGTLLSKTALQQVVGGTPAFLTWATEEYDVTAWADLATFPTRITIPNQVQYAQFYGGIRLTSAAASAQQFLTIYKNGLATYPGRPQDAQASTQFYSVVSPVLYVVPGDYFELRLQLTATRNVDNNENTYFGAQGWA